MIWPKLSPMSSAAKQTASCGAVLLLPFIFHAALGVSPAGIEFVQSAQTVEAYDFVEVTLNVDRPSTDNPFTEVVVGGQFSAEAGPPVPVDGFCDSADGSIYRIRFMPTRPGRYSYSVKYDRGSHQATHYGTFTAEQSNRRGLARVDKDYPWHFVWEGTGEHYFWNGTTTYWLLGWDDETIRRVIDRLHRLRVTRLRVAINGRVKDGQAWFEHVYPTDNFKFRLNPWLAERPDSVGNPGFDVRRFNVPFWQKIERMLRYAREKDMVISIIFYLDGARPGVDPFGKERMGQVDEQRYYRYAVARLAAFSNLMWDVTNEYHLFRNEDWANQMGTFIKRCDPYDHLTSVHGHAQFPFRTAAWADFAMYQCWDEAGGYRFMLNNRRQQQQAHRPMPQVNEEYGYEDHYPTWGGNRKPPARCADNRRRLAWGMYMAGGYQTTGERADTGTGWGGDTGGGWINGRGDDSMIMLHGYAHIVDFFTSIPWWTLEPDNDFFETDYAGCVKPELTYVAYARDKAGRATLYVDGVRQASANVTGDFSNWDSNHRLALANELTRDRPWLGQLRQVAIYDRALSAEQVQRHFQAGCGEVVLRPQVLYDLRKPDRASVIKDTSGHSEPLDLRIEDPSAVKWLPGEGLQIHSLALIASPGPATRLSAVLRKSGEITIEAWLKPANATQAGPARIVTLSTDPGSRNFTLGQRAGAYDVRLRTTSTSINGEPSLATAGADDAVPPVVGLRWKKGDLAVLYFPAGGRVRIDPDRLESGLRTQWFNPRTGQRTAAQPLDVNTFVAPDNADWVLLLHR